MKAWLRKIAGKGGKASRSKRGASSHVNTRRNKRASNKAVRVSRKIECMGDIAQADELTHRYLDPPKQSVLMDTFAEDHHLDIPDELLTDHDPHEGDR